MELGLLILVWFNHNFFTTLLIINCNNDHNSQSTRVYCNNSHNTWNLDSLMKSSCSEIFCSKTKFTQLIGWPTLLSIRFEQNSCKEKKVHYALCTVDHPTLRKISLNKLCIIWMQSKLNYTDLSIKVEN